jgi:hypothetical protein
VTILIEHIGSVAIHGLSQDVDRLTMVAERIEGHGK